MLVKFAERHKFKIVNNLSRSDWTDGAYGSLQMGTMKKIDYIMTDRPDIFLDVSVINSLNTGSDHRMMRESKDWPQV